MAMLNHHKELTARLQSARYLHVVREYNSAADSLAGETLETRVSKVVLSTDRKTELSSLNRLPEVIYEVPAGDTDELNQTTGNFVQTLDAEAMSERKTFVDFVRPERGEVSVVTRGQSKARDNESDSLMKSQLSLPQMPTRRPNRQGHPSEVRDVNHATAQRSFRHQLATTLTPSQYKKNEDGVSAKVKIKSYDGRT
ncbi:hypothetical protein PF003_g33209 [Phytophthora fragariae]|nr:hypothetical protein PF003_g33209 [Phytophthora fragariae]